MNAEEVAARIVDQIYHGPSEIKVSKAFYDAFCEAVDPWKRELTKARRQLSGLSSK